MMLRRIGCGAALALGLCQMVAPAGACDGTDCRTVAKSTPLSKPLQLDKFMRTSPAKPAHAGKKRSGGQATHARQRAAASSPAATKRKPIPDEASAAFASQPSVPVRVVASDELNEIDRAAGPAHAETTGAGPHAEDRVQLVDATEYNDIDRRVDDIRVATIVSLPSPVDASGGGAQSSPTRLERLWAILQRPFIVLGAAFRYLFG